MKRIVMFMLSMVLLIAGVVSAQNRRGPGGPGPHAGMPGMPRGGSNPLADYLALTADQKAAWETIQSETREALHALHEQERTLAGQLETATDAASIGNLVLQLRGLHTQIQAAREASQTKFAALLTSDQQLKFAAFQAASEFLHQRGPGGGPHPPR
jgi:Spy/CpxP family protein refolding chaperone